MNIVKYPKREDWELLLKRPTQSFESIEGIVLEVFTEVQKNGDTAIQKYTEKFDGVSMGNFKLSEEEIAIAKVPNELADAINLAKSNIEIFHKAQIQNSKIVETSQGVQCWQEQRPISKVGLYIPGGTAPLFSTILMLAIPAQIAGCEEIILCTPPDKDGVINPAILYTAKLCDVTQIYKVGGIQAIAAMTFGTETVPKVYKIFGPGNQYVTVAKQFATRYEVAIDMPAGPSELLVYADETAIPKFVASDLLSQAEHGIDSQVVLVTTSEKVSSAILVELNAQLQKLPRKIIAEKAVENSKIFIVKTEKEAVDLINEYAPEHYILISENEDYFLDNIKNAGSVFIGNYTPESAGDYASGTNHTLPTNGYAKQYSGVSLASFMKIITFQKISESGIKKIGPSIELMAAAEGLGAHKNAVTLRLQSLKSTNNQYNEK
jgi:histidinol dehydrogenase